MPQVRIAEADEEINEEEGEEYAFDQQEVFLFRLPFFAQFIALIIRERRAEKDDHTEYDCDRCTRVWDAHRASHPREPAEEDESQGAAERVALVYETGHSNANQRIDRETEDEDENIPDEQTKPRIFVLHPIVAKQLRPCAARALAGEFAGWQQQRFVIAELTRQEMDDFRQINRAEG